MSKTKHATTRDGKRIRKGMQLYAIGTSNGGETWTISPRRRVAKTSAFAHYIWREPFVGLASHHAPAECRTFCDVHPLGGPVDGAKQMVEQATDAQLDAILADLGMVEVPKPKVHCMWRDAYCDGYGFVPAAKVLVTPETYLWVTAPLALEPRS